MRVITNETYPEVRDAISHDWVELLDAMDIEPVFVPNRLRDPARFLRESEARGLILTGGNDLGAVHGEAATPAAPAPRDRTEFALLDAAVTLGTPVLGVCRGLQVINVHFGGHILRDVGPLGMHVNARHPVDILAAPSPGLRAFGGTRVVTNSYHGQGVLLAGIASELRAFAVAPQSVVEGLYHPTIPVLAVQWHPERDRPQSEFDGTLLRDWLSLCA